MRGDSTTEARRYEGQLDASAFPRSVVAGTRQVPHDAKNAKEERTKSSPWPTWRLGELGAISSQWGAAVKAVLRVSLPPWFSFRVTCRRPRFTRNGMSEPTYRPPTPADAEACGRIVYEAFRCISAQHN